MMKWLEGFGINTTYILLAAGVGLIIFAITTIQIPFGRTFGFIVLTSPVWLPVVLFFIFFETWLHYVRKRYVLEQGRVTLEIKIPQEITKSPLAMELVLNQMYQTAAPDNHFQTYLDGKHPPTYGLEIVSDGGRVRFFINTPRKKFKNIIETQLYAQYPGIEIIELPIDYTARFPWDPDRYPVFSIHFGLKKPDPYPIKTYIDFGLDRDPKEEYKIDPITSILELLGSIGPKEQIWLQILISAHREVDFKTGEIFTEPDWKDEVREEINKLAQRDADKSGPLEFESAPRVTQGERDTILAMERSLGKYAFNTAIRTIYLAEKDAYLPGERIGAIITMWKGFDDFNRNQLGFQWRTDYDWNMWQDPSGKRRRHHKERELDEYKRRDYEHQNAKDTHKVMTTEELATIFHLPGQVALTPTLERIPSTKAQAPANLPTGNAT